MANPQTAQRMRQRRPFPKMMIAAAPLLLSLLLATLAPHADALEITFRNLCSKDMLLSNGKTGEKIKKGGFVKKTLAVGAVEAFRYSSSGQATPEFSVQKATTWYDIGIIPTGDLIGPGNCTSLENCKAVTGGTGFNVAMKIIPRLQEDEFYQDTCRTVNCFADGCPDAYQHPHDPNKTRNCPSNVNFTVVFCATPSTGSSDGAELESAVISVPATLSTAAPDTSAPSPPPMIVSTTHTGNASDGTSVAVIIASIIGGFVTVFAGVILVRRWRYTRLEKMNATRYSSEAMIYIEARDTSAI